MNKMLLNQKDDDKSGDKNKTNNKNVLRDQESDSDDDETDGWCTFKTIVSNNDKEDHSVSFDQTKKIYKLKVDA